MLEGRFPRNRLNQQCSTLWQSWSQAFFHSLCLQAGQKSWSALSFTGSLVSFCGEIVERTLCASPKNEKPPGHPKQIGKIVLSLLRSSTLVLDCFCFREPVHLAKCAAVSGNSGSMPGCCILLHVKGLGNCTLCMWRWEWECSIQKAGEVQQWQPHRDGRKSPSSRPSSVIGHAACVRELMVCVVLCLLRDSARHRSQRKAQRLCCSRLPCCDGCLHYCHLPAASQGFAPWSQDSLPELGTQDLKVLLSLEPLLLSLKPSLNLTSHVDFPHPLFKPSSLTIPSHKLFSYHVTNEDQPNHPKKTWCLVSVSSFWHQLFHIADFIMFIAHTLPPAVWALYLCQFLTYLFLLGKCWVCSHVTVSEEKLLCSKLLKFLFLLVLQEKPHPPH